MSMNRSGGAAVLSAAVVLFAAEAEAQISGTLEAGLEGRNDIVFFSDFEEQDWPSYFSQGTQDRYADGVLSDTTDPQLVFGGAQSARSFHEQGVHGGGAAYYYMDDGADELHLRVYFMMAPDFVLEPANAMKIIQLFAYRPGDEWACTAGVPPTGTDCASCHIVIEQNMQLHFYVYHLDQSGGYGDEPPLDLNGGISLDPGVWYSLEIGVRLNTLGQSDGWVRGWVDGVQEGEMPNLRFRTVDDLQIRRPAITLYTGGAGDINTAPQDQYSYFDHFVVANSYIGPMSDQPIGGGGAGPTGGSGGTGGSGAASAGGSGGASVAGGGGSTGGLDAMPTSDEDDGGCGCRLPSSGQQDGSRAALLLLGLLLAARRRRLV